MWCDKETSGQIEAVDDFSLFTNAIRSDSLCLYEHDVEFVLLYHLCVERSNVRVWFEMRLCGRLVSTITRYESTTFGGKYKQE